MGSDKDQISSVKFIQSLKAGNPLAFKKIFLLFEKRLYLFVFSITKSGYISQEIVQEVFIKIWTKRESLDTSQSFDSYIFTLTRNLTYNYLRDASRRETIRNELWSNISIQRRQVEDDLILAEYRDIVEDIVRKLPLQKRSIYELSRLQGKSNTEIAEILGISPKTVKNHLWHTMTTIRSQLQPYLEDSIPSILILMVFVGLI